MLDQADAGSQAYRANRADRRARERALRPKPCRLALYSELRWRVAQKLALQWSPQQISGWLKQEFPTHQDMQISHEAIYRSLFIQTRGVTFLPERTTRTSPPWSSAIPASRCSSRFPARTRRLLLPRLPSTSASCLRSCDAP